MKYFMKFDWVVEELLRIVSGRWGSGCEGKITVN